MNLTDAKLLLEFLRRSERGIDLTSTLGSSEEWFLLVRLCLQANHIHFRLQLTSPDAKGCEQFQATSTISRLGDTIDKLLENPSLPVPRPTHQRGHLSDAFDQVTAWALEPARYEAANDVVLGNISGRRSDASAPPEEGQDWIRFRRLMTKLSKS